MSLIATLAEEALRFRADVECKSLWKISEFRRPIEKFLKRQEVVFATSRTVNYQVPVLATGEIHAFASEIEWNLIGIHGENR